MTTRPQLPTVIAHVDMNTFFVSVERLTDPSLEGKPVAVGGDPGGRSVVSSASYEARLYGVHSAMPMSRAVRLCPQLVIVHSHFRDYQRFHDQVKAILQQYTPTLEMTSIDEGYLDLTGTEALLGPPAQVGLTIWRQILDETCLPASIGISANKLISKVASDQAKPVIDPRLEGPESAGVRAASPFMVGEGVMMIPAGKEAQFLAPLPIANIPGCGKVTTARLGELGYKTIGQLAVRPEGELEKLFGDHGKSLWRRANGIGSTKLTTVRERKSISKEKTFAEDVTDRDHLRAVLHQQATGVGLSLRRKGFWTRTVTIKVRYAGFETHTHSQTLPEPTDQTEDIFAAAAQLLGTTKAGIRPVRLIGVGVSNLVKAQVQEDLFDQAQRSEAARRTAALDDIRQRFGKGSIVTGESVKLLGKGK